MRWLRRLMGGANALARRERTERELDDELLLLMIVRENLSLSLVGVAIGLGISATGAAMLASYLFGVTAGDPASFAGGAVVLCLVSLVASYLPARRAARIDPMLALRYQ